MGGVYGQDDPLSDLDADDVFVGVDDRTQWVLDRIVDLFPGSDKQFEPYLAMKVLEEASAALSGRAGCTLFGLSSSAIAPERHAEVLALLRDAIVAWREWAAKRDGT